MNEAEILSTLTPHSPNKEEKEALSRLIGKTISRVIYNYPLLILKFEDGKTFSLLAWATHDDFGLEWGWKGTP